ncbi:MAG TPA: BamA/TamA family outer membrane protein, partial [Candidatus Xenobia bacterium]
GYALYDDRDVGASVTFGRLINEDLRLFLTLKKEHIEITEDPASQFVPVGLGTGDINSVALAGLYDTRDDIFNPHKGTYINLGVVGAGGPLGGNFKYTKVQGEFRKYIPMKKDRVIATRFWGGSINGTAPVTEFFFLGGIDTLRAYPDNSLLGTSFILANAEFRFPIAKLKLLSGAVFAEAGNAYNNGTLSNAQTFNNGRGLLTDGGVGLRLVYPSLGLGVIRLDYAVGQNGGRSSVGIGQSF